MKALIYGPSGAGKTHFAATAPKPVFLSAEAGLLSTLNAGGDPVDFAEIKSLQDLFEAYETLKKGDHKYETVVIDSISEINEIIKESLTAQNTNQKMKLDDWGTLATKIRGILRKFRDLDMHVIFIAQETPDKDENRVVKWKPSLNGKAADEIAYYMDIVGYVYIDQEGNHKITTNAEQKYVTKSRVPLESSFNFRDWVETVAAMEIADTETEPAYKLDAKRNSEILKLWKQFADLTQIAANKSVGIRHATINKRYGVESNLLLQPEQADDFIKVLKENISIELDKQARAKEEEEVKNNEEMTPDDAADQLVEASKKDTKKKK